LNNDPGRYEGRNERAVEPTEYLDFRAMAGAGTDGNIIDPILVKISCGRYGRRAGNQVHKRAQ
jgi:hypothetical protein